MDWEEVWAPQGIQPFTEQFPPFSHPGPGALKSVPDEGFPVGIRCSCSTANHTRPKKENEEEKKKKAQRLKDNLVFSQSSLS